MLSAPAHLEKPNSSIGYFEISVKGFPFVSIPKMAIVTAPTKWTRANAENAAGKPP